MPAQHKYKKVNKNATIKTVTINVNGNTKINENKCKQHVYVCNDINVNNIFTANIFTTNIFKQHIYNKYIYNKYI